MDWQILEILRNHHSVFLAILLIDQVFYLVLLDFFDLVRQNRERTPDEHLNRVLDYMIVDGVEKQHDLLNVAERRCKDAKLSRGFIHVPCCVAD